MVQQSQPQKTKELIVDIRTNLPIHIHGVTVERLYNFKFLLTSSEGQLTSGTTPDTQQIDCLSSCPLGDAVEASGPKQLGSGRAFSPLLSPTCIRSPYSLPSFPTCAYCSPDYIYGHSMAHFYSYCIFYCTEFISVFTFLHHCIYHIDSKLLGIASTYL
ncbi:hypothetical protein ILYODFUR_037658 [Ilyodon furcidens]|uniref:Uncharacterized protein n=1 Tax=Ilyodon furcidens TaxID=33524 RepID=A0ABV0SSF4_9TELE